MTLRLSVCFALLFWLLPLSAVAAPCRYDKSDIEALRHALSEPSCDVGERSNIIGNLEKLGPEAVTAVPELIVAIDAEHPPECNFRECVGADLVPQILRTLKAIGPNAAPLSVPRLAKFLAARANQYPVEYAYDTLIAFGAQSLPALPAAVEYLSNQPVNSGHRGRAIALIAAIGPEAGSAKSLLWEIARRDGDTERRNALKAVATIDPNDEEVFRFLLEQLALNEVTFVELAGQELDRRTAARTVPRSALPALRAALLNEHYMMETRLLAAIATLESDAAEIRRDVLKRGAGSAQNVAAAEPYFQTLKALGGVSADDVDLLCPYVESSYTEIVKAAIALVQAPLDRKVQKALLCCNVHNNWAASSLFPTDGGSVFEAAKSGDPSSLKDALRDRNGGTIRAKNGETLLNWLVSSGRADLVRIALERRPDVNELGLKGKTALITAAERYANSSEIIEMLLAAGAARNETDCSGKTALAHALSLGRTSLIGMLDPNGNGANAAQTEYSQLVQAVKEGRSAAIETATLQQLDSRPEGLLPLVFVALESKRFDLVQLMVERGIRLDGKDSKGEPFLSALLLRKSPPSLVDAALTRGVDANTVSKNGWPALHLAASQGDEASVQALLKFKASLDMLGSGRHTAMGEALVHGHYGVAKLLKAAGAAPTNYDLTDAARYAASKLSSRTPANQEGREQLLYLLDLGLSPKEFVGGGWNLLHHAIWGGDVDMVRELLRRGADRNDKLGDGRTPLALLAAAELGSERSEALRALLNGDGK